jgi:hypothetical protein
MDREVCKPNMAGFEANKKKFSMILSRFGHDLGDAAHIAGRPRNRQETRNSCNSCPAVPAAQNLTTSRKCLNLDDVSMTSGTYAQGYPPELGIMGNQALFASDDARNDRRGRRSPGQSTGYDALVIIS